jgi:hypothetical protein
MIRSLLAGAITLLIGVSVDFATPPLASDLSLSPRPISIPSDTPEPTPTESPIVLSGRATWFDARRHGQSAWYTREGIKFYGAAGPALRSEREHRWRGRYRVLVTSEDTGRAVLVWIVDFCECRGGDKKPSNDRLVDLAPAVWHALGVPLGRGVTRVTVKILAAP